MTASSAFDATGNSHFACIGANDGSVYYRAPHDNDFHRVDNGQSNARSGCDITIDQKSGTIVISYVNGNGNFCTYHGGPPWVFTNWGGQAK